MNDAIVNILILINYIQLLKSKSTKYYNHFTIDIINTFI